MCDVHCEQCAKTLVTNIVKDHVKISLVVIFNSILPLSYLLSDSITSFDFHVDKDPLWSGTEFILMWNPFLVRSLAVILKLVKNHKIPVTEELLHLVLSIPFVNQLDNIYNAFRLYRLKYGKYPVKRVEEVQFNVEKVWPAEETRSTGVSESSLELGPQHLLHLKIILSNSNLCYAQVISLPIIFFILAWASHREEAEQELAIMVPMLFLPWLLLVALHTIMIWRNVALILGAGLLLPSYIVFVIVAYKF